MIASAYVSVERSRRPPSADWGEGQVAVRLYPPWQARMLKEWARATRIARTATVSPCHGDRQRHGAGTGVPTPAIDGTHFV